MWIVTLFFSLILVAVLQMWIFSRFGFKRLTYRRWFTPNVVNEGDTVTMSETIRNEKRGYALKRESAQTWFSAHSKIPPRPPTRHRRRFRPPLRPARGNITAVSSPLGPIPPLDGGIRSPARAAVITTSKALRSRRAICWAWGKTEPAKWKRIRLLSFIRKPSRFRTF